MKFSRSMAQINIVWIKTLLIKTVSMNLLPKCVIVACQVRYRRCHPRDGGTNLASTASDQDSDLRELKNHKTKFSKYPSPSQPLRSVHNNNYDTRPCIVLRHLCIDACHNAN